MFYLEDGRQELFQWDIDVAVVVEDESITEVHFANRRMSTALVCKVENGKAYIPNILLQEHLDIKVFAWDKNYTKYEKILVVNKRPKPENYIYTETQLYSVQQIAEEVVEKALEEYDTEIQEILKNFDGGKLYKHNVILTLWRTDFTGYEIWVNFALYSSGASKITTLSEIAHFFSNSTTRQFCYGEVASAMSTPHMALSMSIVESNGSIDGYFTTLDPYNAYMSDFTCEGLDQYDEGSIIDTVMEV